MTQHLGDRVQIQGAASGLHLVAWFPGLPSSAEAPAGEVLAEAPGVGVASASGGGAERRPEKKYA